ncbi:response regulator [Nostoc sp. CENA67]|uniref:Response regulator n=1 Tax=Amazonocrinis nigriterrae CENA67 TaxID=2794033 RepID=A0A8J7HXG6_9NOST|nr:response regulator [Amazonocrinis nigriterrae]MBH8565310.1 response regulator [Amazonocrinis nigriterrae CENA67]
MKILLVEDDRPMAAVLCELLTTQYYTVELATDGEAGLALATSSNFDLILLDLLIPKLDGISLCRQLRTQGIQKPILLLTAKDQSADVVKGLDAGADDYLTKPYQISELLARIRALLRRGQNELAPTLLTWENLCVNPVSAEVTYKKQLVSLSPKEYSLLGLFLRNPQRVFSRSDIIDRLWSFDATPSEATVTNLIKDLRQKLKAAGMCADLFETVYGLGYRLKTPPKTEQALDVLSVQSAKTQKLGKARKEKPQTSLASVNKVIERYKDTFVQRVTLLEQVEQALQTGKLQPELQQRASNEAHKLAGTLGSFGYEIGSKLAKAIEHLLMDDKLLGAKEVSQLAKLIIQLKEALSKPPTPITIEEQKPPQNPLVLVINDQSLANQLKAEAMNWGVEIEAAGNWAIAQQKISQSPQAVLLNINQQQPLEDSLTLLQKLKEQLPNTAILAIAEQDNLTERVAVSRLGIQRYLHKPVANAEVFAAIAQVLPKSPASQAKVLILDDDPIALELLSNLLSPWGLGVKTLQDPRQFWQVLIATIPDLLVIDLEMPTYNGIDLCRVVRQDPKWGNLPILVVTAHTDIESIQQVFAAGADDFISKPVVGPELVTRVISRIDRSRLQQELTTLKRRIRNS